MAAIRQRRAPPAAAAAAEQAGLPALHDDDLVKPHGRRRSGKHHTSTPKTIPLVLGFTLFYVVVVGVVMHFHNWLPEPVGLDAPADTFSEARTRVILEKIQSFGYRPVGTRANEVLTPEYLLSQIESIKANVADRAVQIDVDVQRPTGAFGLDFLTQFQNIYANVTNIVVRVADTSKDADPDLLTNALMISSHYDAAIGGAAASDDGVNIAIMVELLRYFALHPPKHAALIFNFNGAEETIMQAAHGFITQHPWSKTIKAFINLEAAGAGGRELLFQTGSDELALAYAEGATYPHASIIAQEMFQSGVIPADTDFRVYRDFGAVAGMDFAYIANGYVYHTQLDDITRIQQGAIQRLGDNLIGVIDRLTQTRGRLEKVAATPYTSNTLFFDVAGMTMVTMSKTTTYQLCFGVLFVAVVYLIQSPLTVHERVEMVLLLLRCFGAGLGAALLTSVVLTLFAPLTWYSSPYWSAVMFVLPTLAGMLNPLASFLAKQTDKSSEALWKIEEGMFEAMLGMWLIMLVVMLGFNTISAYAMAVWVIFPLVGQVVCHALQRLHVLSSTLYILISLFAVAIPALHSGFVMAIGFTFFVPLMGRSGPQLPPDIVVAVLFALSLAVMLSFASRFFCFVPVQKLFLLRNVLAIIAINAVIFCSARNPYSDDCPKRLIIQHVYRATVLENGTTVAQDSGLWVNALDFRGLSTIQPFLGATQWSDAALAVAPRAITETVGLYGDMPFSLPARDILPERHSWYLKTVPPVFSKSEDVATLHLVSSTYDAETNRRKIHMHFTGPSHLNIYVNAQQTRLTSWSIGNGVDGPVPAGDVYILQFANGLPPSSFHFWIEAESNNTIDLAIVGHHLEKVTPELLELRDALPSWMDTTLAVSTWTSRTI